MSQKLTKKQRAFVAEYLVDLNASAAARRAGYSESTAASIGHENLRKPHIAAAIQAAMDARAERTEVTQDQVLLELARIAFSDLKSVAEWGQGETEKGIRYTWIRLLESEDLPEDVSRAIAEVSMGRNGPKVKLHSKTRALELLGKHLKLFIEQHEVDLRGVGVMLVPAGVSPEEWAKAAAEQQRKLGAGDDGTGGDGADDGSA